MKSGMLFGLTSCFLIASSLFVPMNLNLLLHSSVLMMFTIYAKMKNLEPIGIVSLVLALVAFLSILPFSIHPSEAAVLYYDNKQVANGPMAIFISIACAVIGSLLLMINIISV